MRKSVEETADYCSPGVSSLKWWSEWNKTKMTTVFIICYVMIFSSVAGEWAVPPEEALHSNEECDLQQVDVNDFVGDGQKKTLLEHLSEIDAPVLINGALSTWAALDKWQNMSCFLDEFGDIKLRRNVVTDAPLEVAQGWCLCLCISSTVNSICH